MVRKGVILLLLLGACSPGDEPTGAGDPPSSPPEMMRLSDKDLAKCRSEATVRAACPTRVPRAREEKGFAHRSVLNEMGRKKHYFVFSVEWGAPYHNRLNQDDRPPRFSHVVVHAGDLSQGFGFGWPGRTDPPPGQPEADLVGRPAWGPRRGELVLAPPYPFGGLDGSHLIFRWSDGGPEYALSMHAWKPVAEARANLREVVLSIP